MRFESGRIRRGVAFEKETVIDAGISSLKLAISQLSCGTTLSEVNARHTEPVKIPENRDRSCDTSW